MTDVICGRIGATCATIDLTAIKTAAISGVINATLAQTAATSATTFAMATAGMQPETAEIFAVTNVI